MQGDKKKTLMRSKPQKNNTPPHPHPKLDMGGEKGTGI